MLFQRETRVFTEFSTLYHNVLKTFFHIGF